MKMPDAIALDFDGVLCNGLREYFQVALKAYRRIWPEATFVNLQLWEAAFGRLRPVVETGWEMPVVLRAIAQGKSEAALLDDWPSIRMTILAQTSITPAEIGVWVDSLRDEWIQADLTSWLALHDFYSGTVQQIHHWMGQGLPVFVITTKESRFVKALFQQAEVELPDSAIFGKDCLQPKAQTLRQLQAQGFERLWFVEDRLATLLTIQPQSDLQSVGLFLADWGYNTVGDRLSAAANPAIQVLSLPQFSQPFEQWVS
ncbi:MAG TPA: HAD family hydrolase [Stenomitos sp.]